MLSKVIKENTTITNIYNGNISVVNNSTLNIIGIVNGNIAIDSNCFCNIHGVVNGIVYNNGGIVNVFGKVSSLITTSGTSNIDNNAVVIRNI